MFGCGGECERCGSIISCSGNTDNIAVKSKLCRLGIDIYRSAKGHIDYRNVTLDSIVKTEHKVRASLECSVFVTFCLDDDNIYIGSKSDHTRSVHLRSNNTRNRGSVSLLVFDQRPIVFSVLKKIVLDNLVLGRII